MKTIVSVASFRIAIRQALEVDCHAISYKLGNLHFITKEFEKSFSFYVDKGSYKIQEETEGVLRFKPYWKINRFV